MAMPSRSFPRATEPHMLNPAKAAISEAAHLGAIKAKLDGLIPDHPVKPKEKDKA